MIGRLEGRLHQLAPGEVIVDTGGVGWLVQIGLRTYQELAGRERASLWTHLVVRSDALTLYGFSTPEELTLFQRLIGVAGVGPRTALAVLSGMTPRQFLGAIEEGNAARLRKVPGVGKKTADRIVLELKGLLPGVAGEGAQDAAGDALSALVNLGYSTRESEEAVRAAALECPGGDLADLLRHALRILNPVP